jgi:SAM-dependent methyltransferase
VQGSFLDLTWPPCDAVVASLSLHHVRTTERKLQLYREIRRAVRANGLFISADCCPSTDNRLREIEFAGWRAHLRASYSEAETDAFFAAWAEEDVYVPLAQELELIEAAGFRPEVIWRLAPMAVLAARAI